MATAVADSKESTQAAAAASLAVATESASVNEPHTVNGTHGPPNGTHEATVEEVTATATATQAEDALLEAALADMGLADEAHVIHKVKTVLRNCKMVTFCYL